MILIVMFYLKNISFTFLSAKTKANGSVLTKYIIIKQSSLIYKYTCIVIAEEKPYIYIKLFLLILSF
jgi:hypothetical protein